MEWPTSYAAASLRLPCMHTAGHGSWRVGVGGGQAAHSLLFIRDVCRLTPSGPEVPPALVGDLPEIDLELSSGERVEMSVAWLDWWRRFVRVEGATQRGEFASVADPDDGRTRQWATGSEVFDPSEFTSLSGSAPLQKAAQRVGDQALRWGNESRRPKRQGRGGPEGKAAWLAQKSMAESVIEEYQVDPGRVSAGVILLAVTGLWSSNPEPGVLLCSEEFFDDGALFPPALKRTFETGLRRPTAT
jgi:hypothetical protein